MLHELSYDMSFWTIIYDDETNWIRNLVTFLKLHGGEYWVCHIAMMATDGRRFEKKTASVISYFEKICQN